MAIGLEWDWDRLWHKTNRILREMSFSPAIPTREMCQLLVVGEDHRFRQHPGVDPIALGRAVWMTVFRGQLQGGSTIAMQLVRVLSGRYERTLRRKVREMILAVRLTRYVGRFHLPSLYLWVAHYGWEMDGFLQARSRLEIDPDSSSLWESALLVARLKYPERRRFDARQLRRVKRRARHLLALRRCQVTRPEVSAIVLEKHPVMVSRSRTVRFMEVELGRSSPHSL